MNIQTRTLGDVLDHEDTDNNPTDGVHDYANEYGVDYDENCKSIETVMILARKGLFVASSIMRRELNM